MIRLFVEITGEWRVDTPKGFVKADAHVNLESIDNFVINANFDSDKVKHRKIRAEIANKPTAKNGKTITITVTSDGKNVITGRYFHCVKCLNRRIRFELFQDVSVG